MFEEPEILNHNRATLEKLATPLGGKWNTPKEGELWKVEQDKGTTLHIIHNNKAPAQPHSRTRSKSPADRTQRTEDDAVLIMKVRVIAQMMDKFRTEWSEDLHAQVALGEEFGKAYTREGFAGPELLLKVVPGEYVVLFSTLSQYGGSYEFEELDKHEELIAKFQDVVKKGDPASRMKALIEERGIDKDDAIALLRLCVEENIDFTDPAFPPDRLETGKKGTDAKRPTMFLPPERKPVLFLEQEDGRAIDPEDMCQGDLGDCWVLGAISSVAESAERITSLFGLDGEPDFGFQQGGCVVRLCISGLWTQVVLDSYLPIQHGAPRYGRNKKDGREQWGSLLEKAFAKVYGNYENLSSGSPMDCLYFLTGYSGQRFNWPKGKDHIYLDEGDDFNELTPSALWGLLRDWDDAKYIMYLTTPGVDISAYVKGTKILSPEAQRAQVRYRSAGLTMGHAYSLLSASDVELKDGSTVRLCKIRNPWGSGKEWTGDWGDTCSRWSEVPLQEKERLQWNIEGDGVFFMAFEDTLEFFAYGGACFAPMRLESDYRWQGKLTQAQTTPWFAVHVRTEVDRLHTQVSIAQESTRGTNSTDELTLRFRVLRRLNTTQWKMIAESRAATLLSLGMPVELPKAGEYLIVPAVRNNKWLERKLTISLQVPKEAKLTLTPVKYPVEKDVAIMHRDVAILGLKYGHESFFTTYDESLARSLTFQRNRTIEELRVVVNGGEAAADDSTPAADVEGDVPAEPKTEDEGAAEESANTEKAELTAKIERLQGTKAELETKLEAVVAELQGCEQRLKDLPTS